jgi:hypothetical protein
MCHNSAAREGQTQQDIRILNSGIKVIGVTVFAP